MASVEAHVDFRRVRTVAGALLVAQLAGMIAFSALVYHRYALSTGFGMYAQAWSTIGRGNLHPHSSFLRAPFWQNDAEFIMWPLALLYRLYPHSIDLLVLQDVVLVATEAVALTWILDVLRAARDTPGTVRSALAWGALVVVLADPFAYETIAYDFHTEAIAALFVILAGRALWRGSCRQLWVWAPLALCSLALAATYVIALGLSGLLAGRRTRLPGALLVAAGVTYIVVLGAVDASGFGQAHSLGALYGYLVGPHHGVVRPADVLLGTLRHPGSALWTLLRRWYFLFDFFVVFGLVGLWSVWTWPIVAAVMLPSALSAQIGFLNPLFSFQSWPTLMFVLVGSVMVLVRMADGGPKWRRAGRMMVLTWAVGLLVVGLVLLPSIPRRWLPSRDASAAALARLDDRIPSDAEVVASSGFVGRFATRASVYGYGPLEVRFPVERKAVFFVIVPGQGNFEVSDPQAESAIRFLERTLNARSIVDADGVHGIEWSPPSGITSVSLPGPHSTGATRRSPVAMRLG